MSEKCCPKRPTATPTIHLLVAVDLGWVSRDVIEGMFAEPAYIIYGERFPCGSFLRRLLIKCFTAAISSIFTATTLVRHICAQDDSDQAESGLCSPKYSL